jgi:hypothetical protein
MQTNKQRVRPICFFILFCERVSGRERGLGSDLGQKDPKRKKRGEKIPNAQKPGTSPQQQKKYTHTKKTYFFRSTSPSMKKKNLIEWPEIICQVSPSRLLV